MANPSDSIPTFEQYKSGTVSISKNTQYKIVSSTAEDKSKSNTKLTELTTNIRSEITKLQKMCSPFSTLTKGQKDSCGLQISNHETNLADFNKLHLAVNGMTTLSLRGGSRRKTLKGRRKNKSRRNRKSRR
uniref:Uncharacterized protein n=1 Tax=viral metagenome TaxID=1070528 RepID=A0A6C0B7Z2_9ZZZZ